ncbi:MAG TPA: helix-turn-helix domain-containing protein [Bacteroidetes bacterium]|nr:helix-turn-helix domain-containing protein [Bacteroidota bacterium]
MNTIQITFPNQFVLGLLCCFFSLTAYSQSQDIVANIREISEKDGLRYREIFCSYQDHEGFLWLGTQYGLAKYDGNDFTYFTKEKDGLESNAIHQIIEDEAGVLWLVSYDFEITHFWVDGLSFLDTRTGRVFGREEVPPPLGPGLKNFDIVTIMPSDRHRVNCFDRDFSFHPYVPGKGLLAARRVPGVDISNSSAPYTSFGSEQDGFTLGRAFYEAGFHGASDWIDKPDQQFSLFHRQEDGSYLGIHRRSPEVIYRYSASGQRSPLGLPAPPRSSQKYYSFAKYRQSDRSIWYASNKDFFVYFPKTGGYLDFRKEYPDYFRTKTIKDIHFGKDGLVFVSTTYGLYIIQVRPNPFAHFLYNDLRSASQEQLSSCRTILQMGEKLLVGYYPNNYSVFDLGNGKEVRRDGGVMPFPLIPYKEGVLLYGHSDHLVKWWFGDGKQEFINQLKPGARLWSLHLCKDSTLLIGSEAGLGRWKEGMEMMGDYEKSKGFPALRTSTVYQFLDTGGEGLLLATSSGIYQMDEAAGVTARYWSGGQGKHYFPFDDVLHVFREKNSPGKKETSVYWVSTQGGGLIKWDKAAGRCRQFTTDDGLPSDIIYAVYADKNGLLWMPTYNGLAAFDRQKEQFRVYTTNDGLSHNEFNRNSHYQADDGRLYFGGLNGVNAFYPSDLLKGQSNDSISLHVGQNENTGRPLVHITSFRQFDGRTEKFVEQPDTFLQKPSITIRPGITYSTLTMSMLDFIDPQHVRFEYKFDDCNCPWRPISGHTLELNDLSPGSRTLLIKGQNTKSLRESEVREIPIFILKPFYLKGWFICAGLFFLAGSFFLFHKYKSRRLARRKEALEKEVERRTAIILEQKRALAADEKKIKEQAAEIKKLGMVIHMSKFAPEDVEWLNQLESIIRDKMPDSSFKAQDLAAAMHHSRSQFYRKLKSLTGLTPGAWLQETRLQKAKELLEKNELDSVKAVAYEVGIKPGYFAEAYRKRFGKLPSEY